MGIIHGDKAEQYAKVTDYALHTKQIDNSGNPIDSDNPLPITIDEFNTNDIEESSSTITYIGLENKKGNWWIKKIDTSSNNSFQHATVTNNGSYTTYDTAWANRATLTYENYGDAF